MKKDLIKEIEKRLFEAEVTLQYFKDTGKEEFLIEEQGKAIEELKRFLDYLKK